MERILFIIIVTASICTIMYAITGVYEKIKELNKSEDDKLDVSIAEMYLNQLKTMIQYETIYEVDALVGREFNAVKGVTAEIPNDRIAELATNIQTKVLTNMSPIMRKYLCKAFGDIWILDFIKIHTLSMLINYHDYTITSIINI